MENIIVTESCQNIRKIAWRALTNNWHLVAFGMIVYYILTTTVGDILDLIVDATYSLPLDINNVTASLVDNPILSDELAGKALEVQQQSFTFYFASSLYSLLLAGAFSVGLCQFMLNFVRYRKLNYSTLFCGFDYYLKTIGLFVLIFVKTMLWTLLFIVPGIIASFNYSQAYYILAENPSKGVYQCVQESIVMMRGNKGKYFCLILSYLGWAILASLCSSAVAGVFAFFGSAGWASIIVAILSYFPLAYFDAYSNAGMTVFYDFLNGKLVTNQPNYNPVVHVSYDESISEDETESNKEN